MASEYLPDWNAGYVKNPGYNKKPATTFFEGIHTYSSVSHPETPWVNWVAM